MELAQRPGRVVEVVRADLTALGSQLRRIHEGRKAGGRQLGRPRQERLPQAQAALARVLDFPQRRPESRDGRAGADAARGLGVRDLALQNDEHATVADEAVIGEDDPLLTAVFAIRGREVQTVDGGRREPTPDVVELLRFEAPAADRKSVQARLAIRDLVVAVNRPRIEAVGGRCVALGDGLIRAQAVKAGARIGQRQRQRLLQAERQGLPSILHHAQARIITAATTPDFIHLDVDDQATIAKLNRVPSGLESITHERLFIRLDEEVHALRRDQPSIHHAHLPACHPLQDPAVEKRDQELTLGQARLQSRRQWIVLGRQEADQAAAPCSCRSRRSE
jgi:hypothetical protein